MRSQAEALREAILSNIAARGVPRSHPCLWMLKEEACLEGILAAISRPEIPPGFTALHCATCQIEQGWPTAAFSDDSHNLTTGWVYWEGAWYCPACARKPKP